MSSELRGWFDPVPIQAIPADQEWPNWVDTSGDPVYSQGSFWPASPPPSTVKSSGYETAALRNPGYETATVTGTIGNGVMESINFTTHKKKALKSYIFGHPSVTISVWNSNERRWSTCQTDTIKLVVGNKMIKLERYVRLKEVQGGITVRYPISVASLQWRPNKTVMPAFLERLDAPAKQTKRKTATKQYKQIFYFEVPNGGELQRVQEDEIPPEAAKEALDALKALHYIQEKIVKLLSSSPQSVWIRLASTNRPVEQNGPVQILLGPKSRYHLVETADLPLGGGPPFLWDSQNPDNVGQTGEDDTGISLYSDGFAQKQENWAAAPQVPRFPTGVETVFKDRESEEQASRSVTAESGTPNDTRSTEDLSTEAKSAGTRSSYNTRMPEFNTPVVTLGEESQPDEEQAILVRLTDIERELELLRERRVLTRKLKDIKARKTASGNSAQDLFE